MPALAGDYEGGTDYSHHSGAFKDVILVNGQELENPLNQESVSFRGLQDGEYIVNVMHYVANGLDPLPVMLAGCPPLGVGETVNEKVWLSKPVPAIFAMEMKPLPGVLTQSTGLLLPSLLIRANSASIFGPTWMHLLQSV